MVIRSLTALLVALAVPLSTTVHATAAEPDPVRETVMVETRSDSDRDGRLDRIALEVVRPRVTAAGRRVATVLQATPYTTSDPLLDGWYDEYFVPRGFAFVEVAIQGTGRSEGCPTIGGRQDTASVEAAIGWLTGRSRGWDAAGRPLRATWSLGRVGMVGLSYDGTLANAAAAARIPGLATIVPIGAISSWYDYARDHGIGYAGALGSRYPEYQALRVVSPANRDRCAAIITALGDAADDATYDYNRFWQERDYRRHAARVDVPVLVAHGLSDPKVRNGQFARWWQELRKTGGPHKLWLHRGGHEEPDQVESVRWRNTLHRWMEHWLYGADNGITSEPAVDIQRPDASWETHATWPQPGTRPERFWLGAGDSAGTLTTTRTAGDLAQTFTDDPHQRESSLVAEPDTVAPHRLVYLTEPAGRPIRLSGTPRVEVTMSADQPSVPLTAILVHYPPTQRRADGSGKPERPPVITRGTIDVKNRHSLTHPIQLRPGRSYRVGWQLQAIDHIVPAGHRIGLVLAANVADAVAVDSPGTSVAVTLNSSSLTLPIVRG